MTIQDDREEYGYCSICRNPFYDYGSENDETDEEYYCCSCEEDLCFNCCYFINEDGEAYCEKCFRKGLKIPPKETIEKVVEKIVEKPVYVDKEGKPASINIFSQTRFD